MKLFKIIFILVFLSNNLLAQTNYFSQGLTLFEKKDFEKAKFKFEQDIVFNPKNEKSYLFLSKIFNKLGKEKRRKNLNTVILLNPKNEEAVFNLAKLKLKKIRLYRK